MQPANSEHLIQDTNPDKNLGDISDYDRLLAAVAPPKCPIKPKSDMCIVVQDEAALYVGQGSTKILIPDSKREKPRRGVVVATGPGYLDRETGKREPMQTVEGERVIFGEWAGTAFSYAGVQYLMMRESDIYGTIPPFSLEELEAMKESKDAAAAEEARMQALRDKAKQEQETLAAETRQKEKEKLLESGMTDEEAEAFLDKKELPVATPEAVRESQDFAAEVPTEKKSISLDTNVGDAKKNRQEPRLEGRRGRKR